MKRFLLCLLLLPAAGQESEPRQSIAAAWEKLATWCVEKKLFAEGRAHAAEALALDPRNARAKTARDAAGDAAPADSDRKEYASRRSVARKQVASLYLKWAALKDDWEHDGHWMTALELDPKGIGPLYEAEWREAIRKAQWKRVGSLVAKADEILGRDPRRTAALREAETKASDSEPFLKKASAHELRYWFSLPRGWSAARKWPVLVVLEGAGCNFEGDCRRFMKHRADLPLIIVSLCSTSNTNGLSKEKYPWYSQALLDEVDKSGRVAWDDAGLMVLLDDLKRDYSAEEKFFITGYSGGGILAWWNVLTRPARLLGAFPACANFGGGPRDPPVGGRDAPVRAFQGGKDPHLDMLNGQWKQVEAVLAKWGYTNFSRKMLPDDGHVACHAEVIAAVRDILKK